MELGLFMQPVHPLERDYSQVLEEDREAVLLADELGFSECWIGEHFTAVAEPITDPLSFCASLIHQTKQIKFGTGVIGLSITHPVIVAARAAMFDHLAKGRFLMGVGPGSLASDVEVFQSGDAPTRGRMAAESIEIILKLWAQDAPYDFKGEFFNFELKELSRLQWGVGQLVKPYQQPHPPIAMSLVTPNSSSAAVAGERGYIPVSGNFTQPNIVKTHWTKYVEGCARSGRVPDPSVWRVARSIFVSEDGAYAQDYVANPAGAMAHYWGYLMSSFRKRGALFLVKPDESIADDDVTELQVAQFMTSHGTAAQVLEQLIEFRDVTGDFGTLVSVAHDWDDAERCKRSMRLLAEEVMPRFTQHCEAGTAQAPE
jgi:alkanesulfonate monooxygenase SsuD/methylene tetrahydromethanopterin reductase-like flavin-dependent oxidoreductase (luciferase family)